ncbi:MAG TPA: hypothetical protein VGC13_16020 [Longimicrobium sp.]|uniref:hypothetical protein n=1 Tax=Longimicrobium sp. TaxID=2029185 RepID=UPI002ED9CA30
MSRMPHRIFCASAWALVMATACGELAPGEMLPARDDAAVYRAVLAAERAGGVLRPVVQRTSEPALEFVEEQELHRLVTRVPAMPGLDASTVRSFLAVNSDVAPIPDLRDTTVSWVSREEWRAWPYGWSEHFARHPDSGGVIVFSRVGYSRDGAQALVYVTRACPPCGGVSDFVLLSRARSVWTVTARANVWMT